MTWDVNGKRVLVTGGNSGIGKATARGLAERGAEVMITARDAAKGRAAAAEISAKTGNDVGLGIVDLASLASVRSFADDVMARWDRLDILINNAGMLAGSRRETEDGFEWTLGVNHLGPFLLTNQLLGVLRSPARIINVSSDAHRSAPGLDFADLQMTSGYSSFKAYAASKLANILFTTEAARRFEDDGITSHALHPGVVATGFGKDEESPRLVGLAVSLLKPFFKKPEEGAATSVHLATAAHETIGNGRYWSGEQPTEPSPAARDRAAAERLWIESETLVGLR